MKQPEFYQYKGRIYVLLDEIQIKHPDTRVWYVGAVYADEFANRYVRDLTEFYQRFSSYQFPAQRDKLEDIFTRYQESLKLTNP